MITNLNNFSLGTMYSKRIIIKRYYLTKQMIQKESLFVFSRLLSLYYLDSFSSLRSSIKGILKFDSYSFGEGYVLEIYYEQIDSKKVDNYLKNSYLKTDLFLNSIIDKRFDEVPYIIVTSKEKALSDYKKINSSSCDYLLSYCGIKNSYPILDINLISSTSYSEIERVVSSIKTKAVVQEIILDRNHNILSYNNKKNKDIYPFNYNLESKDIYNNLGESTLGYILEFNEIRSLKDYSCLNIILDSLKERIRNNIYSSSKVECKVNYFDISKIRGMVTISFKSDDVLNAKSLIEREITSFFSNEFIVDKNMLLFEKLKGTKLLTNHKDAISRLKTIQDYSFKVDYNSLFYQYEIKNDDIKEIFNTIKMIKNINNFDDGSI